MEGKIFTIFTASKNNVQNNTWLKPGEQNLTGEKRGKGVKRKNTDLVKISAPLTIEQPQELIPIQEPHTINVHIEAKKQDQQVIEMLKKKSNRLIMTVSSTWDIFPTIINIQETKVSVIFHDFLSTQVHSMDIKDISNVFIESAFLFANLTLITRTFIENDVRVPRLDKKQAIYARRLIEGLRLFCGESIDTSKYEIPELIEKLEDVSQYQREI